MDHTTQPVTAAPASSSTAALIIGDIISFLVFAGMGRGSHGEATGLGALGEVASTAAPFILGWFAVTPFVGALGAGLLAQPDRLMKRTALAWLLAWPVGLLLRALLLQRAIPLSFAIVVGIVNLVLLLGWRGAAAWLLARHRR